LDLSSRDLDARQLKRRGERSRGGFHEIRGTVVSVAVGVHVLRTFDFIDDLHTQLFHNHPSLVMFDRRKSRRIRTLRASGQQAASCSCGKSKGLKTQKK